MKVITNSSAVSLPWTWRFGADIRGGTPALHIDGYYLSVFHTIAYMHLPYKLASYLMGAVQFCPEPPFHVHAMTPYPLVDPKWEMYTGAWLSERFAYVVFPTGLSRDPHDSDLIHVSMGHQDTDGKVVKMSLRALYSSMDLVTECNL